MNWKPTWEQRLSHEGREPDPRFSFANERTFLAWIRTSLALIAAGLGVDALATNLHTWSRTLLAGALIALGGVLSASAFGRWLRSELAMRNDRPLPLNRLAPFLGYGLSLGAVVALVVLLLNR